MTCRCPVCLGEVEDQEHLLNLPLPALETEKS